MDTVSDRHIIELDVKMNQASSQQDRYHKRTWKLTHKSQKWMLYLDPNAENGTVMKSQTTMRVMEQTGYDYMLIRQGLDGDNE